MYSDSFWNNSKTKRKSFSVFKPSSNKGSEQTKAKGNSNSFLGNNWNKSSSLNMTNTTTKEKEDSFFSFRLLLSAKNISFGEKTPQKVTAQKPAKPTGSSIKLIEKLQALRKEHEKIKPAIKPDPEVLTRVNNLIDSDPMDVVEDGEDEEVKRLLDARKADINNDEKQKVLKALRAPPSHNILIDKFNIDMTVVKFKCLEPRTWLNDEVINFYMCLLQDRDEKKGKSDNNYVTSHYFNSFFFSKLVEGGEYEFKNVRRWSRKFDVFSKDKVFIPINISNTHWTLAVVFMRKKEIHYYDSMSGSGKYYLRNILKWVKDEAKDKKGLDLDVSDWKLIDREDDVPQQKNGFDCGLFVIVCSDHLSDDLPLLDAYSQDDMLDYRVKVGAAILRGEINY